MTACSIGVTALGACDASAYALFLSRSGWPPASELRIGLGCMRLSTDGDRDQARARETIAAAAWAGVTVFDTAHAYGPVDALGHNERLLATALRACGAHGQARIVTKGGMARPAGRWVPDGRARAIRADCEASLAALDGLAIDLYLLHAPDPRVPWLTSVRALARLADDGLVARVGLANVSRRQLDEALTVAPVAAVQVALSVFDDRALRGGLVDRCAAAGLALIAHSPLGGPRRVGRIARVPALVDRAHARGATPAQVALAWLLALSDAVLAIPGARRAESARSAADAARLALDARDAASIARALGAPLRPRRRRAPHSGEGEVVIAMGIPGAGKSRVAEEYVARGYVRLNRDLRGGSLPELVEALDERLSEGIRRFVLDNTYLTRASRSGVVEAANRHRLPTRCVWLETPLAQAQVNLVERLLERFGALPAPEELRRLARREAGLLAPTSQMRALRELEPPTADEGLAQIERRTFTRSAPSRNGAAGVFVAAAALRDRGWRAALAHGDSRAPHLLFDWAPGGRADDLAAELGELAREVSGTIDAAVCPHGGGPPRCWCRPPLPGLPLAFARARGVEVARSVLIGARPAHRQLAAALGAGYVAVEP